MAAENATETLRALKAQWQADTNRQTQALSELQAALNLAEPPNRIECYDISNTQGTASVGSMVVFEQGVPSKKLYRRFNIKTVAGPGRFCQHGRSAHPPLQTLAGLPRRRQKNSVGQKVDQSFALLPDLLMVDGGKGQLARRSLCWSSSTYWTKCRWPAWPNSKKNCFAPGRMNRCSWRATRRVCTWSSASAMRPTASPSPPTAACDPSGALASRLDKIPGIGPARRKLLLNRFGTIERIISASLEELTDLPGITPEIAEGLQTLLEE